MLLNQIIGINMKKNINNIIHKILTEDVENIDIIKDELEHLLSLLETMEKNIVDIESYSTNLENIKEKFKTIRQFFNSLKLEVENLKNNIN